MRTVETAREVRLAGIGLVQVILDTTLGYGTGVQAAAPFWRLENQA